MGDSIDNVHPALRSCFHPVCRSADLLDNAIVPVRLLGDDWAVARIGGRLVAIVDRCPHRFAPLSAGDVVDGTVQCAYHGYRFGPTGAASTCRRSARARRSRRRAVVPTAFAVEERYGLVWMAPEEPVTGIIDVPEWDDPAFRRLRPAGPGVARRRRTDDRELPRPGPLPVPARQDVRRPGGIEVPTYTVERDGWAFVCDSTTRQSGSPTPPGPTEFQVSDRRSTWWYAAPFALRLRIEYYADDVVLTILFFHQPVDARTTKLYCFDLRNDIADGRTTVDEAVAFQLAVAAEDRAMLERLRTTAMPLDLNAEVHTRADRITVEMRRVLADLVATSG